MPTKRPGYNLSRAEIAPKSRVLHTRGGKFGPKHEAKENNNNGQYVASDEIHNLYTVVSTLPALGVMRIQYIH